MAEAPVSSSDKTRLGDLLLERNLITQEQLERAMSLQKASHKKLGEILVEEHLVSDRQIRRTLKIQRNLRRTVLTSVLTLSPLFLAGCGGATPASAAPKTQTSTESSITVSETELSGDTVLDSSYTTSTKGGKGGTKGGGGRWGDGSNNSTTDTSTDTSGTTTTTQDPFSPTTNTSGATQSSDPFSPSDTTTDTSQTTDPFSPTTDTTASSSNQTTDSGQTDTGDTTLAPDTSTQDPTTDQTQSDDVNIVISLPPASQSAAVGSSVTLNVSASGNNTLYYQWRKNGQNIPDAVTSSYTITNVSEADAGSYDVMIGNESGVVISDAATLDVVIDRTALLSWTPPATREDGSVLAASEIQLYRIYHLSEDGSVETVYEAAPDEISFSFDNLPVGTHYFAVSAVDVNGLESDTSDIVTKKVL
ncbi:Type II secretory pathway, ATPase PulE/Tfp pilus assembly pathway, ATPase PilB [Hahella chejuensis KCTC 2396]|uniref:Type II secretory pathway, ATPase PulE/Tfp pilus assembly pathway, ATPase PilB n=1 Tax=Hahella chejuensis (strain KCTC 2396) TaxID=349521 RepID=Q2SNE5_HAHCH|nr:immunoglobulin domain-containing protein [Hahella chejuensis]ABC27829.1 Type II secretory pathway, ATPase PulE/Tfp pilus assembly pathway, ATPase PilB [Hahella chejuensis KCTC 2396]